jgi:hypothetical protein
MNSKLPASESGAELSGFRFAHKTTSARNLLLQRVYKYRLAMFRDKEDPNAPSSLAGVPLPIVHTTIPIFTLPFAEIKPDPGQFTFENGRKYVMLCRYSYAISSEPHFFRKAKWTSRLPHSDQRRQFSG